MALRLLLFGLVGCGATHAQETREASQSQQAVPRISWRSPQMWRGGQFSVPPPFAPQLRIVGTEVLRFHPGFYDEASTGTWTYAFVIAGSMDLAESDDIEAMLETYFLGLGRRLGPHRNPALRADDIDARFVGPARRGYQFVLRAFDSFVQGEPIRLYVEVEALPCGDYEAMFFGISPNKRPHQHWTSLRREREAVQCR